MKLVYTIFLVFLNFQLFAQAAVGINTITPRKTLEVGGDMKISQVLDLRQIKSLYDPDVASFLIQKNDNKVVELDPKNPTGAALGYLQKYIIEDPDKDWVLDFDTRISATDFDIIIISSFFNREIALIDNDRLKFSLPYTSTFISGGTWHIIADYPGVANNFDLSNPIWNIDTLIYSKDLSKQFGQIIVPMVGNTTGTASNPFID